MDKQAAQILVNETFNYPFNEDKFSKFSFYLLKDINKLPETGWLNNNNLSETIRNYITEYKIFGNTQYESGEKLVVAMVKLKSSNLVEKSRHIQRNFAKHIIDNYEADACLISFFADKYEDWRFSFVNIDYKRELTEKGKIKIKQNISPVKRFSYLVGKNEPNHTAQAQLSPLLEKDKIEIADIAKAFSVENVTKEFFDKYKNLCLQIVDDLKKMRLNDSKIDQEFEKNKIDEYDFAKKVMSQIIFLYFLQKRGLLGIKLNNKKKFDNWGTGSRKYIRELFNQEHKKYKNFYNDILEPLFFEGLAKERDEDYFSFLNCRIPFLNGGLFERYYNWSESHIILNNDIISKILDTFDTFNFTVVEEDPLNKEVAIDPEILGKVFESLIDIKERKKQGIFYTPREIVNFICSQTLKNFIIQKLNENEVKFDLNDIETLVKPDHNKWLEENDLQINKNICSIIYDNLKKIKICDPAIGSGAFQLGMLNILVFIFKKLRKQINKNQISDYKLKKDIIQNNLYGIDIENSSVEIARFRLWLSLIIEDESVKKIEPLPNLEYKIIRGDSLEYISENLFNNQSLDELSVLKNNFFNETSFSNKKKLKDQIDKIENDIGIKNTFEFKLNFYEAFNGADKGFDIFIGNPPYIGVQGNKDKFRKISKDKNNPLNIFHSGKMDYFYFFFHQAINNVKNNGQIAFITTNYFLTATDGYKLRSDLKNRCKIKTIVNFNELKIFNSAKGIHNLICILEKDNSQKTDNINIVHTNREGFVDLKILDKILNNEDMNNTKYINIRNNQIYNTENNYIFYNTDTDKSKNLIKEKIISKMIDNSKQLNKFFIVKQGTLSGADFTTKYHLENFKLSKDVKINDGIFVLNMENVRDLDILKKLNKFEKKYIKNFYKNSDIEQYHSSNEVSKKLIYLTWNDKLKNLPNIEAHLKRFKSLLSNRREVIDGKMPWYALHWPRRPEIFLKEKIVVPYRSKLNTFGYNNIEWFCRSDCYVILKKTNEISMKSLLAFLNSKLCYLWLLSRGKRKGNTLELFSKPISEIPIKILKKDKSKQIDELVNNILKNKNSNEIRLNKKRIDELIYENFKLSEEEIDYVEKFYIDNTHKN